MGADDFEKVVDRMARAYVLGFVGAWAIILLVVAIVWIGGPDGR